MLKIGFLLTFTFICLCCAKTSKYLEVKIENGDIVGRYMTSESGRPIRAFMGIPYAEPPINNLRFRSPVKKQPWNGTFKAQNEPPKCTQFDPFFERTSEIVGQEDCLYLNVYAPIVENDEKLPVMINLHGGGWISGSGRVSEFSPKYLLEQDVIFVSGNYRLGILGFLSFENAACPGNFGLKDQSMMLQWVKTNIDKFGGDSNKITIFGESAGGASVHYHMISPMSKGLFNQGILQSGSLFDIWSDPARQGLANKRAIRLAEMMQCPTNETSYEESVECLRYVDARNMTLALRNFYKRGTDPIIPFPPVVEDFYQNERSFISSRIYNKDAFDIPSMIGLTSEEGLIQSAIFISKQAESIQIKAELIREWDTMLPIKLYYDHLNDSDKEQITDRITKFYFTNGRYDGSQDKNLTDLLSDSFMTVGFIETLKLRLNENSSKNMNNTFAYMYSHKGSASFYEVFTDGDETFHGTAHADDLLSLFPMQRALSQIYSSIPTEEDRKLSKSMVKMWVNFATFGQPTLDPDHGADYVNWNPAKTFPIDYLLIGNSNGNRKELFTMEKGFLEDRYQFWEDLRADFPALTAASLQKNL